MAPFNGIGVVLARVQFKLFAKWEVSGREAIPPRGPLIIAANHLSNADPPVVMASFNRSLRFLAKQGLFANPVTSFLFKNIGAHPMSRGGQDMKALRWALNILDQGGAVLMFPEGARSKTASLERGKPGISYLAQKSQAPIIPVALTGTEDIPGMWRVAFPFCKIGVKIGNPFTLPVIEGNVSSAVLQQGTDMVMERIAQLLPPKYRGYYPLDAPHRQTPMGPNRQPSL